MSMSRRAVLIYNLHTADLVSLQLIATLQTSLKRDDLR